MNSPGSTRSANLAQTDVGILGCIVYILAHVVENGIVVAALEGKHHLQKGNLLLDQQLVQHREIF